MTDSLRNQTDAVINEAVDEIESLLNDATSATFASDYSGAEIILNQVTARLRFLDKATREADA
jgi:hypothetical protein